MSKITRVSHESPVFPLKPGVMIEGKLCDSAVVRLLTRGDEAAIQKEPEDTRENVRLLRSIVRLGDFTDNTVIGMALNYLTTTDEVRIRVAIAQLESESLADPLSEDKEIRVRATLPTDITSAPFELNPGIHFMDKQQTICVVRLLRRGEFNSIDREPDEQTRDDLTLLHTIVQIGEIRDVRQVHIDQLVGVDIKRINKATEELAALYAPSSKSCEECGQPIPD
jgi:hypothetical protein